MEVNMLINPNYNFDLTANNLCSRHIYENKNKENKSIKSNDINGDNEEDNFLSEITIQIDNEVETLYVGPVEIKPDHRNNKNELTEVGARSTENSSSNKINRSEICKNSCNESFNIKTEFNPCENVKSVNIPNKECDETSAIIEIKNNPNAVSTPVIDISSHKNDIQDSVRVAEKSQNLAETQVTEDTQESNSDTFNTFNEINESKQIDYQSVISMLSNVEVDTFKSNETTKTNTESSEGIPPDDQITMPNQSEITLFAKEDTINTNKLDENTKIKNVNPLKIETNDKPSDESYICSTNINLIESLNESENLSEKNDNIIKIVKEVPVVTDSNIPESVVPRQITTSTQTESVETENVVVTLNHIENSIYWNRNAENNECNMNLGNVKEEGVETTIIVTTEKTDAQNTNNVRDSTTTIYTVTNNIAENNFIDQLYICEICNRNFNRETNLIAHKRNCHIKTDSPKVAPLSKKLSTELSDPSHKDTPEKLQLYTCNKCNITFKRISWYNKHLLKCCEDDINLNPNNCDTINQVDIIQNNVNTNKIPQKRKRKLNLKNTAKKVKLLLNTEEAPEINGSIKVEIPCSPVTRFVDFSMTTSTTPSSSISPNSDTPPPYSCHLCDAKFSQRCSLSPHILRVHAKEKSKTCNFCNRAFACTGDLTRHIRTHTGDKPFKCTFPGCKYAFISSGDLYKHARRHTKDIVPIPRPHVCEICSMCFERSYDLRRHVMRHKLDDPDFVGFECEICKKRFSRKDQLRMHQHRHVGVKPHRCTICGKAYTDPSNCSKHMKQHSIGLFEQKEFICNFCKKIFYNRKSISRHIVTCASAVAVNKI